MITLISDTYKQQPVSWKKPHTGLTVAQRFVVTFKDGTRIFVKAAMDDQTEAFLRVDHLIMSTVKADFVPKVEAWLEPDNQHPVLVIEDLSEAHWPADHYPVLWKPGQFDILFETLGRVSAIIAPDKLPQTPSPEYVHWQRVAANPDAFLQMALCSERWLAQSLPALITAEEQVDLTGDALVHDDVRSDNLCFLDKRLILVDWSQARRGNPQHDLSYVLSMLPLEGGPEPYTIMPNGGDWAAYRSGQFALRAMTDTHAPDWLKKVFQRVTIITLQWATQALHLPSWEGKDWREL